jgi:hypothetical protein
LMEFCIVDGEMVEYDGNNWVSVSNWYWAPESASVVWRPTKSPKWPSTTFKIASILHPNLPAIIMMLAMVLLTV